MSRTETVRAAGAVLWRRKHGETEVALVHRPKYDDWSFPKGKLDAGETHEDAAVREVEEETACRGALGIELASTSYVDAKGRPKSVRYWTMELSTREPFVPNDEVDQVEWVDVDEAARRLSYDHDLDVLESFLGSAAARAD
jgi:8-oxo-dGTP pyrophosphatase MutT (NUDIX family)